MQKKKVRVRLVLNDFILHDFAFTLLENLHSFSNLRDIFGYTRIGIDDPRPHLPPVGG